MIDIALCFHDSDGLYYRKATTTMLSVCENTSSDIHFHIVHDETLIPEKQAEIYAVAEARNQAVTFYTAPEIDSDIVSGVPQCFGQGTLYRLFLHELISADKIIYLDCDIICELDIKELYDKDISQSPLAAVKDYGLPVSYKRKIIAAPDRYFNAGVLLLNLRWFREHADKLLELMRHELRQNTRLAFADQDVLNIFFSRDGKKIQYLDEKFNYLVGFNGRQMQPFEVYGDKILHMTTDEKPWRTFSNAAMLYWQYYNKTPWGENTIESIIDTQPDKKVELVYFFLRAHKNNLRWLRRYREYKTMGLWRYIKNAL